SICRLRYSAVSAASEPPLQPPLPPLSTLPFPLALQVTINDRISSRVCTACWRHLTEFEQFCLMVADKQQMLQLKTEPEPPPEPAVVVWNTESPIETKLSLSFADADADGDGDEDNDVDIKDHILCEPEIVVQQRNHALDGGAGSCSSFDEDEQLRDAFQDEQDNQDDQEDEELLHAAKHRQTKGRTRRSKPKAGSSCRQAGKPAQSASELRESRARLRELRRNGILKPATSPVPAPAPAPASVPAPAAVPKRSVKLAQRAPKRGRPKRSASVDGSASSDMKPPRRGSDEEPQLQAKRSSIKEMDEYIAANVKLDCCLCAAPLADFIALKRHFRAAHNCTGYVKCCNNRYKKRTLYVDHLHYHKDPEYFSCQACRKRFLNRNSQDMHMLRFHSEQQQLVHQCLICEARFAKKFLLTMHVKNHKGTERPEVCPTCSKTFRTKHELKAHVKRMHASDFTPVICDVCGVHFRSKANFLIHKKALHPEGPVAEVQCSLCGRWLRDERSLRKHLARHDDRDGNNKYRCKLCQAEKSSRVALSSHMRYHHSGKRHSCTLCEKEFKLPRALAVSTTAAADRLPSGASVLLIACLDPQEHMATHTGIDLYSCQFCGRTFKSHANMHNHKKKMHPNEWVRKYTQPSGA
ncbi:hypothetical protein KR222_009599, partial [Zaprionus bogoriensis]